MVKKRTGPSQEIISEYASNVKSVFYDELDIILRNILFVSGTLHGYFNAKGVQLHGNYELLLALYNPAILRAYTGNRIGHKAADTLDGIVKEEQTKYEPNPLPEPPHRKRSKRKYGAFFAAGSLFDSTLFAGIGYGIGYACGKFLF